MLNGMRKSHNPDGNPLSAGGHFLSQRIRYRAALCYSAGQSTPHAEKIVSTKQDKRNKRAKEKAKQANKSRAHGRKLDAIGRQNYEATPKMVELFNTLPGLDENGDMPFVNAVYDWSLAEYQFDGENEEGEALQVAALCVMYIHWATSGGATTLIQNELIEAALRLVEENEAFNQRYQAAKAAAKSA